VLREITERRDAALRPCAGAHRAPGSRELIDSVPVGILFTDTDGACNYANATWLDICAVTLAQARDLGWWAAIHPDDRDRVTDAWEGLSRGAPFDVEFRYQRPSGEIRWVHARASEIRDGAGLPRGYVSAEMDITEQLLQRAALDRSHSRIRQLAQRLELTLEQERDELAGELHGELRQNMTTLRWEIEALGNRAAGPEAAFVTGRALELADACIDRLRRIAFELRPPAVEELGLIDAVKRYADDQAAHSGLDVKVTATGPLPELDPRRLLVLYRAFQEALANTIRHAQATHVEVSIAVLQRSLRLRVVDDGIGLNESDRNKSGCFGLLAASERVAQIGGALRVFGLTGRGTTLEVSVPLLAAT
jgi:two-component system sensor histidine kinase UhpB